MDKYRRRQLPCYQVIRREWGIIEQNQWQDLWNCLICIVPLNSRRRSRRSVFSPPGQVYRLPDRVAVTFASGPQVAVCLDEEIYLTKNWDRSHEGAHARGDYLGEDKAEYIKLQRPAVSDADQVETIPGILVTLRTVCLIGPRLREGCCEHHWLKA